MRLRHFIAVTLLGLLAWLQFQLWAGRGSLPNVEAMREEIKAQQASNALVQQDNDRLALDVADLREGQAMMEAIAREELGMIKPNEVFVQYTRPDSGR